MPANAELTANGHSSMISSSLARAAVLIDESKGAGGNSDSLGVELLQRATRDDYDRWLTRPWLPEAAFARSGCVAPSETSTPPLRDPARPGHQGPGRQGDLRPLRRPPRVRVPAVCGDLPG